jgi:hypothetical protein
VTLEVLPNESPHLSGLSSLARTRGMVRGCVTTEGSSLLCTITQQAVRLCRLSSNQ